MGQNSSGKSTVLFAAIFRIRKMSRFLEYFLFIDFHSCFAYLSHKQNYCNDLDSSEESRCMNTSD